MGFHSEVMQTFRFEVSLLPDEAGSAPLGDGAFQECSGLELAVEIKEYVEGGRNDGVVRRVGGARLQPIVLKRGMLAAGGDRVRSDLWVWVQDTVSGVRPIRRYNGRIHVRSADGRRIQAVWAFDRGLPLKIVGPALNAKTGEIALEELHIVHEGLRLEAG